MDRIESEGCDDKEHYNRSLLGPHDVILGRTRDAFHNEGNKRFRALILEHAPRYQKAETRSQKRKISRGLMTTIQSNGGKFLCPDGAGKWSEAIWEVVVAKITHALRDQQASRQDIKDESRLPSTTTQLNNNDVMEEKEPTMPQLLISSSPRPKASLAEVFRSNMRSSNWSPSDSSLLLLPDPCASNSTKKKPSQPAPISTAKTSPSAGTLFGPHDVLLGRGRIAFNNPGNKRFRDLVLLHAEKYQTTKSRLQKRNATNTVVAVINKNGGRFLHLQRNIWKAMGEQAVREKVSYALRDAWLHRKGESQKTPPASQQGAGDAAYKAQFKAATAKARAAARVPVGDEQLPAADDPEFSLSLHHVFSQIRHVPPPQAGSCLQPHLLPLNKAMLLLREQQRIVSLIQDSHFVPYETEPTHGGNVPELDDLSSCGGNHEDDHDELLDNYSTTNDYNLHDQQNNPEDSGEANIDFSSFLERAAPFETAEDDASSSSTSSALPRLSHGDEGKPEYPLLLEREFVDMFD